MPDFLWKAAQADAQIIEGRLQAGSLTQAMHQLRAQRLTPLQVVEAGAGSAVGGTGGLAPLVTVKAPGSSGRGGGSAAPCGAESGSSSLTGTE